MSIKRILVDSIPITSRICFFFSMQPWLESRLCILPPSPRLEDKGKARGHLSLMTGGSSAFVPRFY